MLEPSLISNIVIEKDYYSSLNRCFILGSGPTLNKFNLSELKNEFVIGANRILLTSFIPQLICISDPLVLSTDYIKLMNQTKCKYVIAKHVLELISNEGNINPENIIKTFTLNLNPIFPFEYKSIFNGNLESTNCMGSVIGDIAIPLAIFLGFKTIYLLGIDSYYDVTNIQNVHFWEHDITERERIMIKDERYRQVWFGKLDVLARLKNIKIFNLSPGSAIVAFEKKDANKLFPQIVNNKTLNIINKILEFNNNFYRVISANNNNPRACSLKNIKNSLFLRHYNGNVIHSDSSLNTKFFNDDSSFYAEQSFIDKKKISFKSCNLTNLYITKKLFSQKYEMHSFKADFDPSEASFNIY